MRHISYSATGFFTLVIILHSFSRWVLHYFISNI